MIRNFWLTVSMVISVLFLQSLAVAEEDSAYPVVEEWSIPAKAGHSSEFMEALKAHAIWRRDNGDSWVWEFYSSQAGREDTGVLIRSTGHKYVDIANYVESEFNQKAAQHWAETVAPYAGVGTRHLRFQSPISYWPDENYAYLTILPLDVGPDSQHGLVKAATALNDILHEAELKSASSLEYTWTGGGPAFQYVDGHEDWASTSPGSSLADKQHAAIVEELGEEETTATYEAAHVFHNPKMKIYKRLEW